LVFFAAGAWWQQLVGEALPAQLALSLAGYVADSLAKTQGGMWGMEKKMWDMEERDAGEENVG